MGHTGRPHDFDDQDNASPPARNRNVATERIFRLISFLTANNCSRDEIFEHLALYYKIDDTDAEAQVISRRTAIRMLDRDMQFLKEQGFEIEKIRATRSRPPRYHLQRGSGPSSFFLLTDDEVESLAFLYTLFADPSQYAQNDLTQPLPLPTTCAMSSHLCSR
jgi:predicted DNA-binding transcriptional regulator YafY